VTASNTTLVRNGSSKQTNKDDRRSQG